MSYDPHRHVKIWISSKPNEFLNLENQIRLIQMREKNPHDHIHFIYAGSLLNKTALKDQDIFCQEYNIIPIDADSKNIQQHLQNQTERKLYEYYKDEILNLNKGGNPAVASDILRWLSPIYSLGTYTDFDFPIDTTNLPKQLTVNSPLIMNIGSLKILGNYFILVNNDFIWCSPDSNALIQKIQKHLIKKLENYDNDFIEEIITKTFNNKQGLLFKIFSYLKNYSRTEAIYIEKSKQIIQKKSSSRQLRAFICDVMSDKENFIVFHKTDPKETKDEIAEKLKCELSKQLKLVKLLFFKAEYNEIKNALKKNNDEFINYMMARELNFYIKSIVICTTGPLALSNALFTTCIIAKDEFKKRILPFSFRTYNLHSAFKSPNSIPNNFNILQMLKFLGTQEGNLNDSSWLNSGKKLQKVREEKLLQQKNEFIKTFAVQINNLLEIIKKRISALENKQDHAVYIKFNYQYKKRQQEINILCECLNCFDTTNKYIDTQKYKAVVQKNELHQFKNFLIYSNLKRLLNTLDNLVYKAKIFRLTKNKKIYFASVNYSPQNAKSALPEQIQKNLLTKFLDIY